LSVADGVVHTIDNNGFLDVFAATSGGCVSGCVSRPGERRVGVTPSPLRVVATARRRCG
jgi:hypothetical protein